MALTYYGLKKLLENHVAELFFIRRLPKRGWPRNRRMFCTNSFKLLGSLGGKMTLNFKIPTSITPYDPKEEELVITWDILMQDFRAIPLESVYIINAIPVKTQKEIDDFWKYFDERIRPMSSDEKKRFMKT